MTTWKAPGKLILFGEHSVVYGKHAVAAALSLTTYATARYTPAQNTDPLTITVHTAPGRHPTADDSARLEAAVRAIAGAHGTDSGGALEVWVRGNVPEGAGLGSSAALCVATSAAVRDALTDYRCTAGPAWRTAVNAAALAGERVFHASPSGVDNTVSTHGGAAALRVLVVDTGVPRSTAAAVLAVRARRAAQPAAVDAALARMDAIALAAFALLQARPRDHRALDALVDENHRLLRDTLGVGHPAIDRAVALCAAAGVHAKITGAGCGGCVFGFLAPTLAPRTLDGLTRVLTDAGMRPLVVTLGALGVSQVPAQPPL